MVITVAVSKILSNAHNSASSSLKSLRHSEGYLLQLNTILKLPSLLDRYVITPEIFVLLEHTDPGVGGEVQLTDGLRSLLKIQPVYAYNFEGRRYDAGDKRGFLEATVEYALCRPDLHDGFLNYLREIVTKEKMMLYMEFV